MQICSLHFPVADQLNRKLSLQDWHQMVDLFFIFLEKGSIYTGDEWSEAKFTLGDDLSSRWIHCVDIIPVCQNICQNIFQDLLTDKSVQDKFGHIIHLNSRFIPTQFIHLRQMNNKQQQSSPGSKFTFLQFDRPTDI